MNTFIVFPPTFLRSNLVHIAHYSGSSVAETSLTFPIIQNAYRYKFENKSGISNFQDF